MEACTVRLLLCLALALPTRSEEATSSANYYDALDLEPTATETQIKKAFRSLALKYHPDKNKSQEAEESFRQIAEAYKVLSNRESRKLYDQLGHAAFERNASGKQQEEEEHPNFDDIFHFFEDDFFGEEPFFMFSDDPVFDYHTFDSSEFSFVFSDMDEYEEDLYF